MPGMQGEDGGEGMKFVNLEDVIERLRYWSGGFSYVEVPTDYAVEQMESLPMLELVRCGECDEVMALETLPSAQPERKKGEWIIKDNFETGWYRVTCSECGEDVTSVIPMIGFLPNAKALWDFCPECGADMRGEQE